MDRKTTSESCLPPSASVHAPEQIVTEHFFICQAHLPGSTNLPRKTPLSIVLCDNNVPNADLTHCASSGLATVGSLSPLGLGRYLSPRQVFSLTLQIQRGNI